MICASACPLFALDDHLIERRRSVEGRKPDNGFRYIINQRDKKPESDITVTDLEEANFTDLNKQRTQVGLKPIPLSIYIMATRRKPEQLDPGKLFTDIERLKNLPHSTAEEEKQYELASTELIKILEPGIFQQFLKLDHKLNVNALLIALTVAADPTIDRERIDKEQVTKENKAKHAIDTGLIGKTETEYEPLPPLGSSDGAPPSNPKPKPPLSNVADDSAAVQPSAPSGTTGIQPVPGRPDESQLGSNGQAPFTNGSNNPDDLSKNLRDRLGQGNRNSGLGSGQGDPSQGSGGKSGSGQLPQVPSGNASYKQNQAGPPKPGDPAKPVQFTQPVTPPANAEATVSAENAQKLGAQPGQQGPSGADFVTEQEKLIAEGGEKRIAALRAAGDGMIRGLKSPRALANEKTATPDNLGQRRSDLSRKGTRENPNNGPFRTQLKLQR